MTDQDFLALLEKYCHINDIQRNDNWHQAGTLVVAHPNHTVLNASRQGYIVVALQRFVRGEIDQETFFGTGDSRWTEPIAMPARANEWAWWLHIQHQMQDSLFATTLLVVDHSSSPVSAWGSGDLTQAVEKGLLVAYLTE